MRSINQTAGRVAALLASFLILAFFIRPAAADDGRVALIIGNAAYKTAPQLTNSVFDAKGVAASFKDLGFKVFEGYDLSADQMRSVVSEFSAALSGSAGAVVYYAGHGVSFDGENYLLPVDINLKTPTDLDLNAISVTQLLRQMHREERANVVILDACRENPFAAQLTHEKYRGVMSERGLNAVGGDLARGALIAFASDPNATAFDGAPGRHSPFTKALIDHLQDPGVSIDTVMQRVRSEVWQATGKQQLPWVNTSIIGEFDLNPQKQPVAASPAPSNSQSTEELLWQSAERSNLAADYQAYLDSFPNGVFATMAYNRIAALSMKPTAAPAESAMKTAELEASPEEAERRLNLALAERKELQLRLTALKYDAGEADGQFGEKARAAIRQWQTRRNLSPTGYFDATQIAALKAESEDSYDQLIASPTRAAPHIAPAPKPNNFRPASIDRREIRQSLEPRGLEPHRRCANDPFCGHETRTNARPAAESSSAAVAHRSASPALAPGTDSVTACQKGMHSVAAPNVAGYRCVLDGY
jgi:uncharacterized caspase-like protein